MFRLALSGSLLVLLCAGNASAGVISASALTGQSRTSITGYTAVATDPDTLFSVSRSVGDEVRTVLEFDVSGLPGGVVINSVTLNLVADTSVGTSSEIELHHYAGDGAVTAADFTAVNATPVTHNTLVSLVSPTLNSIDVTSMYTHSPIAGFRLSQNDDPGTFNFTGLLGGASAPTLVIDYTAATVPEPGTWVVLALGTVGVVCHRRRCRNVKRN